MSSSGPGADSAPIRDAASVVLLRDSARGMETFTLTRATTMVFAASATVFPGGGVDAADHAVPAALQRSNSASAAPATAFDDDESLALPLMATAVRETFEESGVLLGLPPESPLPSSQVRDSARRALEAQELSIWDLFAQLDIEPDFSVLHRTGRWITPQGQPRRYDARFFLAEMPAAQDALLGTTEATSAQWITPQQALKLFEKGETFLMRPTEYLLTALRDFASVEEALQGAPLQDAASLPRVE